ncbi:DNA polymerase III subunit delta [Clostridium perfringens]|uniref:DNA polymerase III subunit delta n=1 Tax=Clostridium perfringens TaxID=1502 RepID=A0ABD4PTR4_CLOPF|nr:DNA polymerase III subunit delta [Clostridium perfringens]MBO3337805.1 DNA polymerase III subunit delta [Clostridium perfringens]MBO3384022.1 DNA polymerase III subunit delta [Clostridium perfringens]MBO3396164.1 DNA polymerase III subunit delta [Clostridium perfringens]MBO3416524.1 DNA polymerase III subunit delta [Clostridium perfringens]MBO3419640.1 DNA polymerase III subunit delta [Clostridium perfringens]
MIDLDGLYENLKKGKIEKSYILVGLDELLIKEGIENIIDNVLDEGFKDLNLIRLDGNNLNFDDFMNACETLPFMSDKKVVVLNRTNIFRDKQDKETEKLYKQCVEYFQNTPEHCVLIAYTTLKDKRDRVNRLSKLKKLEKSSCIVSVEKLKGAKLQQKVGRIFQRYNKNIGKIELKYFCDSVENNFDVIEREVDKIVNYVGEREITRKDIDLLLPPRYEDDIFDLVELISIKRAKQAIDLMDELIGRGQDPIFILSQIREQFQKLHRVKIRLSEKYRIDEIKKDFLEASRVNLPDFVIEKFINQSKKFSNKQLSKCINLCLYTEKKLKSNSNLNKKTELELMIVSTVI